MQQSKQSHRTRGQQRDPSKIKPKFKEQREEEIKLNPLRPLNQKQAQYIKLLQEKPVVVATGFAGSSKSYIPTVMAGDAYKLGTINRIIVTRPAISSSKSVGFTSGDFSTKMTMWLGGVVPILKERLGPMFDIALEEGDTVEFEVASDGGRADGLIALLSALERTPATSVALLNGMAASAASILALNCDMVWVGTNSSMMIHNAHFGSVGTVSNVVKHVDFERKRTEKLIRSTYEHFLTEDEIEAVLAGVEIWLDSEEINDRLIIKASILEELAEEDNDCSDCADCHNTELQYDPVSVAFKHQEDKVISDKVWEQITNNQNQ